MPQTSSDFVVKVSTQGVEQARRALEGLEAATSGMAGGQAKEFAASTQQLDRMTAAIEKMTARLERSTKVSQRLYRVQREALGRGGASPTGGPNSFSSPSSFPANGQAGMPGAPGSGAPPPVPRTSSRTAPASYSSRHPFMSGLGLGALQGVMPGQLAFAQRGPGAIGQILGQSVGNMASQFARAPFTGAQGLVGAIGSVPLAGGLLAAPLANYMGKADQVMAAYRQQVELAPLLRGPAFEQTASPERAQRLAAQMGPPLPPPATDALRRARQQSAITERGYDALRLLGTDVSGADAFKASLVRSGANYQDVQNKQFVNEAMAAKSLLGVNENVSGAFAMGSRTGAFSGQKNADPAQMLMRAINQTVQLGLSGPQQQEYLQNIAESIRNIERTGIPFQMDTVRNLQSAFTGFSGMSALSAQRMASGSAQRAADFMENGPQDAFDLGVMRSMGFKGNLKSYYDTREKAGSNPEALAVAQASELSRYARSPIKSQARLAVRKLAKRMGITDPNFASTFVDRMADPSQSEAMTQELTAKIAAANRASSSGITPQTLDAAAASNVPSFMKRQAAMTNATIAAGGDAVNVVLNAAEVADKLGNEVGTFGSVLNNVSEALHSIGMSVFGSDSGGAAPPAVRATN